MKKETLPFFLSLWLGAQAALAAAEPVPHAEPVTTTNAIHSSSPGTNDSGSHATGSPSSDRTVPRNDSGRAQVKPDYATFRLIADKNIFNGNRSPGGRSASNAPRTEAPKPVKTELLSLVGTMVYDKGDFAFFDGSSPEFRKVVKPTESIGGLKVAEIAPNHIRLDNKGVMLDLPVGSQLKRQDEGDWSLVPRADAFSASSGSGAGSSASSGSDDASDIVKKMMQKREEELKNEK